MMDKKKKWRWWGVLKITYCIMSPVVGGIRESETERVEKEKAGVGGRI